MRQRVISDGRVSLTVSELCLGTMYFGYRTDEQTSFAILDRFREAGGTFLDTANNYGQWHGDAGESERVIGRWLRSRRAAGEMVVATKVGARTTVPGDPDERNWQGLGAEAIRADAQTSLRQLGVDRLDVYYAHIDDRATPLAETVGALGELAAAGQAGLPGYACVQQEGTYLLPQPDRGQLNLVTEELLDYAAATGVTVLAYSPLQAGRYARPERPLRAAYAHAGSQARLAAAGEVAGELGATTGQVALAWLLHQDPPVIPIPGASSVAQLDEILAAAELKLDDVTLERLDRAGRDGRAA